MSIYALFYNNITEDIELYPKLENHNLSRDDIEKYLENNDFISKWTIYDHLPTDDDIDQFEMILSDNEEID